MGSPHVGDSEAGVITLRVEVSGSALEPALAQSGLGAQKCLLAEPFVAAHISEEGQEIVEPEAGGQFPAGDAAAFINREQKGTRPD